MVGMLAAHCLHWLEDNKQPIAVRAFSVYVLSKIIDKEPALGS